MKTLLFLVVLAGITSMQGAACSKSGIISDETEREQKSIATTAIKIDLNAQLQDAITRHSMFSVSIIKSGADPSARSLENLCPLDVAVLNANYEIADYLLKECGVCVNESGTIFGIEQTTALHLAAGDGNESMVRLLIRYGADKTLVDQNNRTPLQLAIERKRTACLHQYKGFIQTIRFLTTSR